MAGRAEADDRPNAQVKIAERLARGNQTLSSALVIVLGGATFDRAIWQRFLELIRSFCGAEYPQASSANGAKEVGR
jgi:hypothetical protein